MNVFFYYYYYSCTQVIIRVVWAGISNHCSAPDSRVKTSCSPSVRLLFICVLIDLKDGASSEVVLGHQPVGVERY